MVTIQEILESLEGLKENIPAIYQDQFNFIIENLKRPLDNELLITIQDKLEYISTYENLDSYTRNEIMNIISDLEGFFTD